MGARTQKRKQMVLRYYLRGLNSAEKKAIEFGIGKIVEKIIPAYKKFGIPIYDCRPLFEPIDFLVFNGLGKNKVNLAHTLKI